MVRRFREVLLFWMCCCDGEFLCSSTPSPPLPSRAGGPRGSECDIHVAGTLRVRIKNQTPFVFILIFLNLVSGLRTIILVLNVKESGVQKCLFIDPSIGKSPSYLHWFTWHFYLFAKIVERCTFIYNDVERGWSSLSFAISSMHFWCKERMVCAGDFVRLRCLVLFCWVPFFDKGIKLKVYLIVHVTVLILKFCFSGTNLVVLQCCMTCFIGNSQGNNLVIYLFDCFVRT